MLLAGFLGRRVLGVVLCVLRLHPLAFGSVGLHSFPEMDKRLRLWKIVSDYCNARERPGLRPYLEIQYTAWSVLFTVIA